jgi:hypothetical protein
MTEKENDDGIKFLIHPLCVYTLEREIELGVSPQYSYGLYGGAQT